jgi:signal transduction histidine kinase
VRTLLELARPIGDEELPHLKAHKNRGVTALACFLALFGPLSLVPAAVALVRGDWMVGRGIALAVASVSASIAIALFSGRDLGRRHPDVLALALGLLAIAGTALAGWPSRNGENAVLGCLPTIPALLAPFVAWRPRYSVALGVCAFAAWVVARGTGQHQLTYVMLASTGYVLAAVMGCQLQRRLWLLLERTQAELAATDRMAGLGRMTANIAHELKTPLAAAMNGIEAIRSLARELEESIGHPSVTTTDLREIVAEIEGSTDLVRASVFRSTDFIQAIRSQTLQMHETVRVPFRVPDVIHEAITLVGHAARRGNVRVDVSNVPATLFAIGDPGQFSQIVTNLVSNAVDACAALPRATVRVSARELRGGILLVVEDDGPGVPTALRERIFEPLFSTKHKAQGSGFGLSISRDLAEGTFGGWLRLVPTVRGARFEFFCSARARAARSSEHSVWTPAAA